MYTITRKTPLALYLRWQIRSSFTVLREKACILFAQEKNAPAAQREDINAQAARILDAYGNNILRLAYSYLHNRSDAEEIVQDTLIHFFTGSAYV